MKIKDFITNRENEAKLIADAKSRLRVTESTLLEQ